MPPLHDVLPFLYETKKKTHKHFYFMQGIYHKAIDKSLKRKGSKNNISLLEQYNKFWGCPGKTLNRGLIKMCAMP